MNEYEFPAHRHEHDFNDPASRKIGGLFARVQDFPTKPELTIYSRHTVYPPYTYPLFQYHRWKANLRVLEITEVKSLPYVPMSHPFVERLIGSIRRELLDQTFFWTATDLENKLKNYRDYYNAHRCHSSLAGDTPVKSDYKKIADINQYQWKRHCRGLFQLPVAA